ncbi:MAG: hypothetical protein II319_05200 [Clostridia bacterium]|nr:hypothetical protein [Clostridia bacterium]
MTNFKWLNLQLFAGEGAGASGGEGGEGAATGDNATVDAGQRLRELGVPEDKIRKRARYAAKAPEPTAKTEEAEPKAAENTEQDAAAENPTEEKTDNTPARMSWDEIMADPEYNKQMQAVVQSRLKSAKGAEEALAKLTPALELLARKHNLDPAKMDYDALTKAISDDDSYYEDKALQMGTSVETAKKIDQQERDTARQQRAEALSLEEQKIRDHFTSLENQALAMQKIVPNFDLQTELKNPAFLRMTSPNVNISVKDAYYAVHHDEMQIAAMQATAKATAQNISNNIQARQRRPDENGISGQAPSATTFDYSKASREQREAFKKDLRERLARGEKVYPGQK